MSETRLVFSDLRAWVTFRFKSALMVSLISLPALGVSPTPIQIQQLKSMSPSQQRQLASQLGIAVPTMTGGTQSDSGSVVSSDIFNEPRERNEWESKSQTEVDANPLKGAVHERFGDLRPYGYSLFASEPTTFAPVGAIPAPEKYVIGPGDRFRVIFFGKESGDYLVPVERDGTIAVPDLDRFNVQGMSFEAVRQLLANRVQERKLGVSVSVTLDELRSIQIFVLGDVAQPGSFAVSSFSTVINALFVAGGVTNQGSLRNIELKRNGQVVARLDLYRLLLSGDISEDLRVQQGDVVFVPAVGTQVAIRGEVKRPAVFEIKPGETLQSIVSFASGFSGFAYEREIRVRRTLAGLDRISRSLKSDELADIVPLGGDLIDVLPVNIEPTNTIELAGLFSRPGFREWRDGIRLKDVISSPRDILIPPLEALVVIESRDGVEGRLRVDIVRATEIFSDSTIASRQLGFDRITVVPVHNDSNVDGAASDRAEFFRTLNARVIASTELGQVPRVVDVQGEVRAPGRYPLSSRETIADMIVAAGGYSPEADINATELVRRTTDGFDIQTVPSSQFDLLGAITPGSVLVVRQDREQTSLPAVMVEGFVRYPGTYRMPRGSTISDLLSRAGGVLDNADLRAAVFTREQLWKQQVRQLERLQRETAANLQQTQLGQITGSIADQSEPDVVNLAKEITTLSSTDIVGRLVVDLPSIIAGLSSQDVILEDGDRLVVPSIRQSVTVMGEVLFPTSHVYQLDTSVEAYLAKSGGMNKRADGQRAYIIRANGAVEPIGRRGAFPLPAATAVVVEPGDTIIVPRDIDDVPKLELWSTVTQIIYQSAVALAAIGSL